MKEFWQEQLETAKKVQELTKEGALIEIDRINAYNDAYTVDDLITTLKSIIAALESVNRTVKFDEKELQKAEAKEQKAEEKEQKAE